MARPDDDTQPAAAAIHLRLLRQATVARRAALARSLSATAIDLSRRALRQRMVDATADEVLVRWLALSYGGEIARCVARRLAERR